MIIGAIAGFAALIGTIWKLLDKYDKKGDKRAVDSRRLDEVEGKVAANSANIENLKTIVVGIDKNQALQQIGQENTNKNLEDIKELLHLAIGNIINEKKASHERTI